MKVYVLETGCYDYRAVRGVFATAEAAMAAWQPKPPRPDLREQPARNVYDAATGETTRIPARPRTRHSYTWSRYNDEEWRFDADCDDAADVTEYEVQT